jgi:hypothetical protein
MLYIYIIIQNLYLYNYSDSVLMYQLFSRSSCPRGVWLKKVIKITRYYVVHFLYFYRIRIVCHWIIYGYIYAPMIRSFVYRAFVSCIVCFSYRSCEAFVRFVCVFRSFVQKMYNIVSCYYLNDLCAN